ncbi:hypothetical protein CKO31_20960 [Thiohalocapsa halophila]|uniref:Sulfotransferase family protein n=2 Tax=Thiohalocapsa halophila TaxID=69359 RepID=A0ABS1CP80_9GAMM|nr:hypothetical protein [Thiohalocapsa halophila]
MKGLIERGTRGNPTSEAARARLKELHAVLKQRKAERSEADTDDAALEKAAADEAEAERVRQSLETPEAPDADKPPLMSVKEREQYLNLRSRAQFSPYFMHHRAKAEEHTRAIAEIGRRMEQHRARRAAGVAKVDGGADVKPIALDDPNAPRPEDPVLAQDPCDIVVVSGLPRSGTSMMMQMLQAGGISPLTDGERAADDDNPKGYYEYEPAKRLMTDRTWLPAADGKAVKVIAQLLPYLPPKPHRFKVIFMERDLDEVAASQARMLANLDKQGARLPEDKMKQNYAQQIAALKRLLGQHGSVTTLWLDHAAVLAAPAKLARRVALFLGPMGGPSRDRPLDEQAMAAVVEPSLHRQRVAGASSRDGLDGCAGGDSRG